MNLCRLLLLLALLPVPGRVQAWTDLPLDTAAAPARLGASWRVTVYSDRSDMFPQYRFQSELDKPLEEEIRLPDNPTRVRPFITQAQSEPGVVSFEDPTAPTPVPAQTARPVNPYLESRLIDPRTAEPDPPGPESPALNPANGRDTSLPVYVHRQKAPIATWDEVLATHKYLDQFQLEGPPRSGVGYIIIKTGPDRDTRTRRAEPEAPAATFHPFAGAREGEDPSPSTVVLNEPLPDARDTLISLPGFNPLEEEEKRKNYRDVDFQPGAVPDVLRPLL